MGCQLAQCNKMVPFRSLESDCCEWECGQTVQFGTTNSEVSGRPLTIILSKPLGTGFWNGELLSVQICKGNLKQLWLALRLHSSLTPRVHCYGHSPAAALLCPNPNKAWNVLPKLQLVSTFSEPHPETGVCRGSWGILLYLAGPKKKNCFSKLMKSSFCVSLI